MITENEILAWLTKRRSELGLPNWASLQVVAGIIPAEFAIYGHTPDEKLQWIHGSGSTIAGALARFTEQLPPVGSALATLKRTQAEKLLAEAAAIDAATPHPQEEADE